MIKKTYLPIISLLALLLTAPMAAKAEDSAAASPASTPAPAAGTPDMPSMDEQMPITMGPGAEGFEALQGPEREKKFSELREKVKNMTPEERQEWRKKRKEWFDALPPEQQAAIKEKMQKHRRMRLERMTEDLPQQCQAVVQKCLAEHGDELPPPRHFRNKKADGEKKQ